MEKSSLESEPAKLGIVKNSNEMETDEHVDVKDCVYRLPRARDNLGLHNSTSLPSQPLGRIYIRVNVKAQILSNR